MGCGAGGVCRAGDPGLSGRGRRDLRDRDLPAGPLERGCGPADGVRPDHRHAADRWRRRLRPCRCQRPDAARPEGHHGRGGAACDGRTAAGRPSGPRPSAASCAPRCRSATSTTSLAMCVIDPDAEVAAAVADVFAALRRLRFGLRRGRRVRRAPVPAARLWRRVGRAAALGSAHPRPGPGDLEEPRLRRGVRVRPLLLASAASSPTAQSTPRRSSGPAASGRC